MKTEEKFSLIEWNQFTRMMVMETVTDRMAGNLSGDILAVLRDHVAVIKSLAGFTSAEILTEEDGRMVVFQVTFSSRERLMGYHQGREYRQLVTKINHFLIGDPVIKLFRRFEGAR